ncbi:MAG: DAK2 domain-containing protein [Clostridia bacterium]|nr:DAK2 domain-containing protein [Clostridia bacterium]
MVIDGQTLCDMVISAANALDNNKITINNMNVFPVPDGDTGINMTLTMVSVRTLNNYDGTVSDCADKISNMVLRSARGNSGAILSLFFRGMAKSLKGLEVATAADLAKAFKRGTDEAYKAVMKPTEGTILTVMRVCSEKAMERIRKGKYKDDPAGLFAYVLKVGEKTLAKTPELLPVLKEANVVDAGGYGFMFLIQGMLAALRFEPVIAQNLDAGAENQASFENFDTDSIVFAYCTECIVNKKKQYYGEGTATEFYDLVCGIGDSAVFVDAEDMIKVHVHTNHPGQVIEKALEYGEIETMKVENMRRQHTALVEKAEKADAEATAEEAPAAAAVVAPIEKEFGFVAVCMGDGIRSTFLDLGVDRVVFGGQTMNPSTQDIIDGVNSTPSKYVYVLPNNKNIYMVACQAAEMISEKKVIVLPTKSVPQGVSALIAYNPDADEATNTAEMTAAIDQVRTAQVTYAVRDTTIDGMQITDGQLMGLVDGKIICSVDNEQDCLAAIGEAFANSSYVTVFSGADIDEARAQAAVELLQEKIGSSAEIVLINGGQPIYDYIISAE